jgi:hypothetical protein
LLLSSSISYQRAVPTEPAYPSIASTIGNWASSIFSSRSMSTWTPCSNRPRRFCGTLMSRARRRRLTRLLAWILVKVLSLLNKPQQRSHSHVIKEKILERVVTSLPCVGTEIDGVDIGIRLHAVIPTLPEEMAVIPRPGLSGGLESMSFRIERTDVSGLDDGSPRATTRRSRRGNRSNVGENGSGGWHCWLVLLVGEGRGDERIEQPVEARLLSNPPSPCHQAISALGSSRHSIGAPRTTLGSSRLHLGLLRNLFGSSG